MHHILNVRKHIPKSDLAVPRTDLNSEFIPPTVKFYIDEIQDKGILIL